MEHKIKVKDLLEFQNSQNIIFVEDHEKLKSLHITLTGNYEVWHERKRIYTGDNVYKAVNTYNNI